MGVEMSAIKDTKSQQGIDGFTHRGDAVLRWILSRSISGEYAKNMKSRCGLETDDESNFFHEQHRPSNMQQDEKDVLLIFNHIKNNMTDPFKISNFSPSLIHIGSGMVLVKSIETSLLNCLSSGLEMLKNFVKCRLDTEIDKRVSFYATLKKSDLKTFSDKKKRLL